MFSLVNHKHLLELIKKDDKFSSTLTDPTSETLSRLKFLGYIQKGNKVDIKNMSLQEDGWTTRLYRTIIYPDNRHQTLKFIKEIIVKSFEILNFNIINPDSNFSCSFIIQDLIKAQDGIINLKDTYDTDYKFTCDIIVLLQGISSELSKLQTKYPELFPKETSPQSSQNLTDEKLN